jgi:hypothetical protein
MGIIPIDLQNVILQFAKELTIRCNKDAEKELLIQWHQIRAIALLKAISVAMAAGAQIAQYKMQMLEELPPSLFQDKATTSARTNDPTKIIKHNSTKTFTPSIDDNPYQFPCKGITCSNLFTSKTNLRLSLMKFTDKSCRRCTNMDKAIACAASIEKYLASDPILFK